MNATARALRLINNGATAVILLTIGGLYGLAIGNAATPPELDNLTLMGFGILIVAGLALLLTFILQAGVRHRDRGGIKRATAAPADGLRVLRLQEPIE